MENKTAFEVLRGSCPDKIVVPDGEFCGLMSARKTGSGKQMMESCNRTNCILAKTLKKEK